MGNPQRKKTVLAVSVGLLLLLFLASFCFYWDYKEKNQAVSVSTTFIMDTFVDQKLVGAKSEQAVAAVNETLQDFEKRVSAYLPESEISRINQNAGLDYVQVSEETFDLLKQAKEYCAQSDGLFDITIGPLVTLWNVTGASPHVPEEGEIQSAMALINYEDLLLRQEDHSVLLRQKGQSLNLGGMAKGAAGALALETAKSYGIHSGYISIGGNMFVIGKKADQTAYRFGIRDPRGEATDYIGVVELTDTTMATSGDYERFFEEDGVRYHHILDPRTGYPGDGDLISVSIICPDGGLADYLSTTLFLAGKEKALTYAEDSAFDFVLVDREKRIYVSKGICALFSLNEDAQGYTLAEIP